MNNLDTCFTQLFEKSLLIQEAISTPLQVFSEVSCSDEEINDFFHSFWEQTKHPEQFEVWVKAEMDKLTKKHPPFSLPSRVIEYYLYYDTNAFHLFLKPVLILYACVRYVENGNTLPTLAREFIKHDVFVFSSATSQPSIHYLQTIDESLVPTNEAPTGVVVTDLQLLFPDVKPAPHQFEPDTVRAIFKAGFELGSIDSFFPDLDMTAFIGSLSEEASNALPELDDATVASLPPSSLEKRVGMYKAILDIS